MLTTALVLIGCAGSPCGDSACDAGVGGGVAATGGGGAIGGVGGGSGGAFGGGGVAGGGVAGGNVGGGSTGSGGGAVSPTQRFVYVACDNAIIYRYRLASDAGLEPLGTTDAGSSISFLAFHPDGRHVYGVNEGASLVSAFAIDAGSSALTLINQVSSAGSGPAHLSVHPSGKWVLVSNYGSGHIGVLPLDGGAVLPSVDTRLAGANAHQIIADSSGRHVLVPCLGAQKVAQYRFDETTGALSANTPPQVGTDGGAGPRHVAFHPNERWAYLVNELDLTVVHHDYDADAGRLTPRSTVLAPASLPVPTGSGAEIAVHPNGRFAYSSVRAASGSAFNSITTYAIDQTDGHLTVLGHTPTQGNTPRHFSLSPDGSLLFVANQGSGTVVAFQVDATTGALAALGVATTVPAHPAYVGFYAAP